MGMFDKIESVGRQFDNNFLRAGRYILWIDEVATGKGRRAEHWRLVGKVVAVLDGDEGRGHKLGEIVKRIRPDNQDGSLPEFKALVCVMYDCTEDEVTPADCNEISLARDKGGKNPLGGTFVEVAARQVETRESTPEKPRFFTRCDYVRRIEHADVRAVIGEENFAKCFPQGLPAPAAS